MKKEEMRVQMLKTLLEITPEECAVKSKKACKKLVSIPEFEEASVIMTFLSLPHEVDTADMILMAWQKGKEVCVPKISWQQRHMIPVRITTLETGFSTNASGLRNPISGVPIPFQEIDLVVTPALAVDHYGNRLGRGGSFYDRFFNNPQLDADKCAFTFEEQHLETVPHTERDVPVDMLVTDESIIKFDSQ